MYNLAFLCTGEAPRGSELLQIRGYMLLWLLVGLGFAYFLYSLIDKKLNDKKLIIRRILKILILVTAGYGLFMWWLIYGILTCGY